MTSTPYQAYPDFPAGPPPQPIRPLSVQLAVAGAVRQRRATVAFRLILIIPHLFALFLLAIAAWVLAFIGWWGALFTGYLPAFATDFLTGFTRWSLRVNAYLYLLTDAYPPFSLDDDPAYPVRLGLPERQRLNRAAVFFRLILGIPADIVNNVVVTGTWVVSFIAWLIALVTGKLPTALHLANAASLRYQTRVNCYLFLLTPAYPGGLFGDRPVQEFASTAPPVDYGVPGYGVPGYGVPGYGVPGYGTTESSVNAPGGYGFTDGYGFTGPVSEPVNWQLILTSSARRLLVLFLVLGALIQGASSIRNAMTFVKNVQTNSTINQVNTAYNALGANAQAWSRAQNACHGNLTCVNKQEAKAATYFMNFATALEGIPLPSGAASVAESQLYTDATMISAAFTQLSQATTSLEHEQIYTSTGLAQNLSRFDRDVAPLDAAINQARLR